MTGKQKHSLGLDDGFVLPVVLGFLFLVTLFVTPFIVQARLNFKSSQHELRSSQLQFFARGILDVVALRLLERNPKITTNGAIKTCRVEDYLLAFRIQDHRGLIDVNASSAKMIELGLRSLNVNSNTATEAARSIVAARTLNRNADPIDEVDQWNIRRSPGLFFDVIELTDLKAITSLGAAALSSVFTTHSKTGQVNKAVAPEKILRAFQTQNQGALPVSNTSSRLAPTGVYTFHVEVRHLRHNTAFHHSWVFALNESHPTPVQLLSSIPASLPSLSVPSKHGDCSGYLPVSVMQRMREVS